MQKERTKGQQVSIKQNKQPLAHKYILQTSVFWRDRWGLGDKWKGNGGRVKILGFLHQPGRSFSVSVPMGLYGPFHMNLAIRSRGTEGFCGQCL